MKKRKKPIQKELIIYTLLVISISSLVAFDIGQKNPDLYDIKPYSLDVYDNGICIINKLDFGNHAWNTFPSVGCKLIIAVDKTKPDWGAGTGISTSAQCDYYKFERNWRCE